MPAGWTLAMNPGATSIAPLAVSPDGRHIAFLARPIEGNQPTMMWIRARDSLAPQMLGRDGWRRIAVLVAGQPASGVFRCWGPQID